MPDAAGADDLSRLLRRAAQGRASGRDGELLTRQVAVDPVTAAFRAAGVELAGLAAERVEMLERSARLCPATQVEASGFSVRARVSLGELWRFYLPLCQALRLMLARAPGRAVLGVAGPGASGKTVFAALVQRIFHAASGSDGPRAVVCPLDGFHYPNDYLDTHFAAIGADERVPLRAVKGAPATFDVGSLLSHLRRLRDGGVVTWPLYDRRLHDVAAEGTHIPPEARVALVEGNYLLLLDAGWAGVAGLLDLSVFLLRGADETREAMVRRFVRGGQPEREARERYERVDRGNFDLIMRTAARADLLVRRGARERIEGIRRPAI